MKKILCFILSILFSGFVVQAKAQESEVVPVIESILGLKRDDSVKQNDDSSNKSGGEWEYDSIIFDKETQNWLKNALKANEEGIPIEILLPDVFPSRARQSVVDKSEPTQEEEVIEVDDILPEVNTQTVEDVIRDEIPTEAPVFALKSIMYFAPNSWSVWINDKKLTSRNPSDGKLHVISVSEKTAAFLLEDSKIEYIYPNWLVEMAELDDGRYVSNNKNVVVDTQSQNMSFVLSPNQSLVTAKMDIIEGYSLNDQESVDEETSSSSVMSEEEYYDANDKSGFYKGHNPADGLEAMQQHTEKLLLLKQILEQTSKQ